MAANLEYIAKQLAAPIAWYVPWLVKGYRLTEPELWQLQEKSRDEKVLEQIQQEQIRWVR